MIRLEEVFVDGFGIFHKLKLPLTPGLNVIFGFNEAGKSTLLAFIRRMFYGFPGGKVNKYEPVHGGKYGGRLVYQLSAEGPAGKRELERTGSGKKPVFYTADGTTISALGELDELAKKLPAGFYRRVLGFTLEELSDFESLQKGEVKNAIFGASAGVTHKALVAVERVVKDTDSAAQGTELGKAKGLVRRALEREEQIKASTDEVRRYDDLHGKLISCSEDIFTKGATLNELQRKHVKIKRKLSVWEAWTELGLLGEKLAGMERIWDFPSEGKSRMEAISIELDGYLANSEGKRARRDQKVIEAGELTVDDRLLVQDAIISRLSRGRGRFDQDLQSLSELNAKEDAAGKALRESLRKIGAEWDETRCRKVDTSEQVRADIRLARKGLEQADKDLDQVRGLSGQLQEECDRHKDRHDEFVSKIEELKNVGSVPDENKRLELKEQWTIFQRDREALDEKEAEGRRFAAKVEEASSGIGEDWTPQVLQKLSVVRPQLRKFERGLRVTAERVVRLKERLGDLGVGKQGRESADIRQELEKLRRFRAAQITTAPHAVSAVEWVVSLGLLVAGAYVGFQYGWGMAIIPCFAGAFFLGIFLWRRFGGSKSKEDGEAQVKDSGFPEDDAGLDARETEMSLELADALFQEGAADKRGTLSHELKKAEQEFAEKEKEWQTFLVKHNAPLGVLADAVIDALAEGERISRLQDSAESCFGEAERLKKRCEEFRKDIASELGVSAESVTDDDIRILLSRFDEYEEATRQADASNRDYEDAVARLAKLAENEERLTSKAKAKHSDWEQWLEELALPRGIAPDTALDVLGRVESCVSSADEQVALRKRREVIRARADAYIKDVNLIRDAVGKKAVDQDNAGTSADALIAAFEDLKDKKARRQPLLDDANELEAEIIGLETRMKSAEAKKLSLLKEGGAADEEEFRHRADLFAEQQKLQADVNALEGKVAAGLGLQKVAKIGEALEGQSHDDLVTQELELASEITELDAALDLKKDEKGSFRNEMEGLMSSGRVLELHGDRARFAEEAGGFARRWVVLRLARELFERTKREYERKHQPEVLKLAGSHLQKFTHDRWLSVHAPVSGQVTVKNNVGTPFEVSQLSRGTAEQLYLALRFGYIRQLAADSQTLPLIMDDVLVNFDPIRATSAAEAIGGLAKSHQVLYLTCHPQDAEMLLKAVPGSTAQTIIAPGNVKKGLIESGKSI